MCAQRFYRLSNNTYDTRGFARAGGLVPRSDKVDWVCPRCGGIYRYPTGAFDIIVEQGVKYPDVLMCGAYPFLIVSQSVVDGWREAAITCFHTFPVGIAKVQSKRLLDVAPPPYHRVEIDGRCQIDLAASGGLEQCPLCHRVLPRPVNIESFVMVPDSWDGSDLFRDEALFPQVSFCTEKVLDLARTHKWTNFRFEPMEGPFDPASKGVDYMKRRRD